MTSVDLEGQYRGYGGVARIGDDGDERERELAHVARSGGGHRRRVGG